MEPLAYSLAARFRAAYKRFTEWFEAEQPGTRYVWEDYRDAASYFGLDAIDTWSEFAGLSDKAIDSLYRDYMAIVLAINSPVLTETQS